MQAASSRPGSSQVSRHRPPAHMSRPHTQGRAFLQPPARVPAAKRGRSRSTSPPRHSSRGHAASPHRPPHPQKRGAIERTWSPRCRSRSPLSSAPEPLPPPPEPRPPTSLSKTPAGGRPMAGAEVEAHCRPPTKVPQGHKQAFSCCK